MSSNSTDKHPNDTPCDRKLQLSNPTTPGILIGPPDKRESNCCETVSPRGLEEWQQIGDIIAESSHVMHLVFAISSLSASGEELTALCNGIKRNRSIVSIRFYEEIISSSLYDIIFTNLIPLLAQNDTNHLSISFGRCILGAEANHLLCTMLAGCRESRLKVLNLNGSQIGDEAFENLLISLATHTQLTELLLGGNKITERGCMALAARLLANPNCVLETLILTRNLIGDVGTIILSTSLSNNKFLKNLLLEGNAITDRGCIAMSRLLVANRTLESIRLEGNRIRTTGGNQIGTAGWNALSTLLAVDTSTISATYLSNHSLYFQARGNIRIDDTLNKLNSVRDKIYVVKQKIFHYHFGDMLTDEVSLESKLGIIDSDSQDSYRFKLAIFSHYIAWIGRGCNPPTDKKDVLDYEGVNLWDSNSVSNWRTAHYNAIKSGAQILCKGNLSNTKKRKY